MRYDIDALLSEGSDSITSEIFRAIIDDLPVAIFAKDVNKGFTIILWNKKQEEVTTIPREKALNYNDYDLFAPDSADYFRQLDEEIVAKGELLDIPEEIIEARKGHETYLHTTKVPITIGKQKILVGICEDITERVKGREQLHDLNRDLSLKNKELESTQLQLIQAAKLESIGRLAAGVAHEVKNPLNLLTQGLDYLKSSCDKSDPNVDIILREMQDAIQRAETIVKGLVDFSSSRQIQKKAHHPVDLVERVLLMIRHEINRHSVEVVREFDDNLHHILVDQRKFEQVLLNTFMNAIHAMEDNPAPELTIKITNDHIEMEHNEGHRTADHLRSGDEVVQIQICDNGCGIKSEHLEKIFDPFFTTKATGSGTGLGLSVVQKIVQLHKGKITLQNLENKSGVCTTIIMPTAGVGQPTIHLSE